MQNIASQVQVLPSYVIQFISGTCTSILQNAENRELAEGNNVNPKG